MNVTEQRLETRAVELEKQLDAANAQITGLKAWIMAANQFAWAHEKGCPRYTRDAPCNCGLDQFLDRPRPFIESYKQQLDAANQRIAELTSQRNTISGHFSHLEMCRDNATVRAESAERKLAPVTAIAIRAIANLSHTRRCPTGQNGNSEQCVCGIGEMTKALAQIEQPQEVRIRIGNSCLTRDLVWCECGRGLSLTGKWLHCPNCGKKINQESYAHAVEEAQKNGGNIYRFYGGVESGELLSQIQQEKEAAERKLAEIASYASAECLVPTPPESQDWASREEWTIEWIRRVATGEQALGQIEPDVNGLEALARRHHQSQGEREEKSL